MTLHRRTFDGAAKGGGSIITTGAAKVRGPLSTQLVQPKKRTGPPQLVVRLVDGSEIRARWSEDEQTMDVGFVDADGEQALSPLVQFLGDQAGNGLQR